MAYCTTCRVGWGDGDCPSCKERRDDLIALIERVNVLNNKIREELNADTSKEPPHDQ